MYVSGFSINVLTMLAVVLSVGLVVDDAIVMAENIYVRIEQGMEPKEAGIDGAKEIFFAVVSTTVTLVSVFLPIVFMEGMTGRLFKEFSIVIAGSVTISSFVALTFTPMLATKLLRKRENKGWLYTKTEPFFEGMNNIYAKSLNAFLNHKWWSIPIVVILFGSIGYFWRTIRSELSPLEDRSSISINIRAQEGATFEFIRDFTDQVAAMADTLAPERQALTVRANNSNGYITVLLPDIKDRDVRDGDCRCAVKECTGQDRSTCISSSSNPLSEDVAQVCPFNMFYKRPAWRSYRSICPPLCRR